MCICTYPPNKKKSREPSHLPFLFSQPQRCGWSQRRRCTCRPTGPWGCGAGVQLRDRRLSFATRMKWVCRCSTGVAYNWSSARRADRPPDRQQHTSDVGRCKSSLGSTCPVSPRHIPSQNHSPQFAARISAGSFAQPAAGVAGVAAGRLLWLASSRCTSSRWCCFSPAWNGSRHGLCTASERLSHTARLNSGLPLSPPLTVREVLDSHNKWLRSWTVTFF